MTTENAGYTRHGPKADEAAERMIRQEVYLCQSTLVDDLLGFSGVGGSLACFDMDNVANLYPDPSEWTEERCQEWLDDHGIEIEADFYDGSEPDEWESMLRDLVTDNAEPAEIFEWWAVSGWLAEKLLEQGKYILDNDYGIWWGRCCTGQSMALDGVFQEIAVAGGWVRDD